MKGYVEVFAIASDGSEELVAKGGNLVVDLAGQHIVDMLTLPSQTSAIAPTVVDASNWGIKAMSFGPAGGSFGTDPGRATTLCEGETEGKLLGTTAYFATSAAIADQTSWINVDRSVTATATNQRIVRALYLSGSELYDDANGVPSTEATPSSFVPPHRLPSYPDPLDSQLEPCSVAYVDLSGDGTTSNGQFQNKIYYNINDPSAYLFGAYAVGYAADQSHASGDFSICLVDSLDGDFVANNQLNVVASGLGVGDTTTYNGREEVDSDGFIRVVPLGTDSDMGAAVQFGGSWSITTDNAHWLGRAWVSGVGSQTSATSFFDAATAGRVMITTKIHTDDLRMFNVYGGLHQMGLWTYDMKQNLSLSAPPYDWVLNDDGENILKYNLFAKKTFTEDLTYVRDAAAYKPGIARENTPLVLRWTLDLRSDIP